MRMTSSKPDNVPASARPEPRPHELRGILCAFIGAACWGFSGTCVGYLVDRNGVDIPWLAVVRLLVAGGLFLIIALVSDRDRLKRLFTSKVLVRDIVLYALFGVILMQIGYMSAIKHTNPGTALLLMEVGVPFVLVYSCLRTRRKPTSTETFSMVLALLGVVFIATQGNIGSLGISGIGFAWGMATAVATAAYNIIPVRLLDECGSLVTNGVGMTLGGLIMLPFVRPWEAPPTLDTSGWLVFLAVVFIGTMFAYVVYLRGVQEAGPVKASIVGVIEPVSAAVISAFWLGTVFSGWDFLGGACIIAMMIFIALRRQ